MDGRGVQDRASRPILKTKEAKMKYVHVRNLDKYHPKYKDRELQWCKVYFTMLNADPDFELVPNEIDKWRFVAFVMLELQIKEPVPLDMAYLRRKGFDLKNRPIYLTLKMLHNFLELVPKPSRRVREEVDKEIEKKAPLHGSAPQDFLKAIKENPAYKHVDIDAELSKMDAWLLTKPGRKKTKQFVLGWLNRIEKPLGSSTKAATPKMVKCPVPGCTEKAKIAEKEYPTHRVKCEDRFRRENAGPLSPEVRRLINMACGRKPDDDGLNAWKP